LLRIHNTYMTIFWPLDRNCQTGYSYCTKHVYAV